MEEDYNPFTERTRSGHAMTTNLETFIHLVKSSLGTGILAMPKAFSYVGLAEGGVLVYAMGAFCLYSLHILINSLHLVCKSLRVPVLQYGEGVRGAVGMGPSWLHPLKAPSMYIVEFFLFTYQLGICCIYVAFAAKNLAMVIAPVSDDGAPEAGTEYMAWVALVLLVLTQIRTLKVLAPVSLAANLCMAVGQAIIWYYIFSDLPPVSSRPLAGPLTGLPHFMGIVLFAMESLGVIIALENNMATPAAFTGLCGILNSGMAVVITLYAVLGFFGFYQYGEHVRDVITLNLPEDRCACAAHGWSAICIPKRDHKSKGPDNRARDFAAFWLAEAAVGPVGPATERL
ncbi:Proton-coupled amino acid transporter-like protein [Frankliniella fusca]|uniref:Proton-coupled amino acid transporter-like protein n=1 Tax=Frankliniella fusca TaxID=407009 RepID=A0AAE1I2H2_9NEOP|nr:Proton-coupled amino acid transporter-like protein [Frankliniella fusca]